MKEHVAQNETSPSFNEIKNGTMTLFECRLGDKKLGSVSVTLVDKNSYNIGGLFVDPSQRGRGISSSLIKLVNAFLERNNSLGKLVNTINGDAASVYENNGWVKGEYKSQDAYGGYEYTYNGKKSP